MPTIGETLREARMRRRLDIADVEASTKIRAKYLRALENEEFGMLPGSTFVKTFLRTYAEVLGLDPHLLVEEYRANYEGPDEGELQPLTPPAVSRRQREPRRPRGPGGPNRVPIVIGAVLALLVFLVVLGWDRDDEEGGTGADPTDQAAGRTEAETETERARRPRERERARTRPKAPRTVTLRITPSGPTYVCLDTGEGTEKVFEGTLTEPQTFKNRRLRLNLGRTAVEIRLNGKPFPVEPSAQPVGFDFTPRGGKPLPSGERPCA